MKVSDTPSIFIEKSSNRKLSVDKSVSTTWTSQHSCPSSCPFKSSGCYAESGPSGFVTSRLNRNEEIDSLKIALKEAELIRNASGKNNLRLHSVGDCSTNEAALLVSEACKEYVSKHSKAVWTYTHAHETVNRKSWQDVSVLGSCENMDQVEEVYNKGYAPALVVSKFEKDTTYDLGREFKGIPCPQQTGKVPDCNSCGLCFQDKKLYNKRRVILFQVHGSGSKKASKTLEK